MNKKKYEQQGDCWVQQKHGKFVYLSIPKNASTTVRQVALGNNTFETRPAKNLEDEDVKQLLKKGAILFTVLRDPLDRLISAYLEVIKRKSNLTKQKPFWQIKDQNKRFKSFVHYLYETRDFYDPHLVDQYALVSEYIDIIDKFILFENVDNDLKEMGLPTGKENVKPQHIKKEILANLDEDTIYKIKETYKEDFKLYKKYRDRNE